jgi:hypothetical protein
MGADHSAAWRLQLRDVIVEAMWRHEARPEIVEHAASLLCSLLAHGSCDAGAARSFRDVLTTCGRILADTISF